MRLDLTNEDTRTRLEREVNKRISLYMTPPVRAKVIDILEHRSRVYKIEGYEGGGFLERPSFGDLFEEGINFIHHQFLLEKQIELERRDAEEERDTH